MGHYQYICYVHVTPKASRHSYTSNTTDKRYPIVVLIGGSTPIYLHHVVEHPVKIRKGRSPDVLSTYSGCIAHAHYIIMADW